MNGLWWAGIRTTRLCFIGPMLLTTSRDSSLPQALEQKGCGGVGSLARHPQGGMYYMNFTLGGLGTICNQGEVFLNLVFEIV